MKVRLTNHLDKDQVTFSLMLTKNDAVGCLVDQYTWSELNDKEFNDIMRFTIKMNEALEKLWH